MALFDSKKPFSYDVIREGDDVILSVNLEDYPRVPSIEDDPIVMAKNMQYVDRGKGCYKNYFYSKKKLRI